MTAPRACWLLVVVASAGLAACSDTPAPARRPQGLLVGEEVPRGSTEVKLPNPPAAQQNAPPPPRSLPSPFSGSARNPAELTSDAAVIKLEDAGDAGDSGDAAAQAGPPRDLPSELRALLGQPTGCLDLAAAEAGGGKITISAVAHVSPTGRVTRATVDAPNQPASALRCFEQRLTSGTLKGPIPNAPVEITTTLAIEISVQPTQR